MTPTSDITWQSAGLAVYSGHITVCFSHTYFHNIDAEYSFAARRMHKQKGACCTTVRVIARTLCRNVHFQYWLLWDSVMTDEWWHMTHIYVYTRHCTQRYRQYIAAGRILKLKRKKIKASANEIYFVFQRVSITRNICNCVQNCWYSEIKCGSFLSLHSTKYPFCCNKARTSFRSCH